MRSIILATATRFLMPMILLFSAFLLLRGHQLPGGGFVGGLVAASAFTLYALAFNPGEARRLLRLDPRSLIGVGMLLALGSGSVALFREEPYLTGQWRELGNAMVGTPLVFDIGVYLVVLGATLAMVLSMAESE